MTTKTNQELIQQKMLQVEAHLSQADYFDRYILETLNSFAYRYFEEPLAAEIVSANLLRVSSLEKGIKEAIKNKNPLLRAGITELVKRVSKAEGPTILRELRVHLIERDQAKGGQCLVSSRISFGHPDHDFQKGTFVEKESRFNFEDDLHLRNTLARHLEEVCELF